MLRVMSTQDTAMSDDIARLLLGRLDQLDQKIDRVAAAVADQGSRLSALEARIAATACPSPGECVRVRADLDALKAEVEQSLGAIRADVDSHRLLVAKVDGGWRTLGFLVAACSMLGGLVGWAFSHFSK